MTVLPRHFERWQSSSKRVDLILKSFQVFSEAIFFCNSNYLIGLQRARLGLT